MKKRELIESNVIVEYMLRRIKKGLGVNAIIIGPPGIGKSYVCLRLAERVYNELHNEPLDVKRCVVNDLPAAFRFVRDVKRKGEVLVIEEVSVIASSRRSMATENVSLNYLLDTVRKKQVILLLNGPHIKAIDKHIQRMSHMLIECLRINKKTKLSTVKAFTLTNSQDTGKVYKHRFKHANKEVHRSFFGLPSKQAQDEYEAMKTDFMEDLYKRMEEKTQKKKNKEAGIKDRPVDPITKYEAQCGTLEKKGYTISQIGKILKVWPGSARGGIIRYKKKVAAGVGAPKINLDSIKIPTELLIG